MKKINFSLIIGSLVLVVLMSALLLIVPSTGYSYSLSADIYTIGSNPAGNAQGPSGANIGGIPSISWIFNVPTAGSATLSILAEGIDIGEVDNVYFNNVLIGSLTQQSFYSPSYKLQPGPGALTDYTAETTSVFNVTAILGDNTIRVDVAPSNWVNEIETSSLSNVPEPVTLVLLSLGLAGAGAVRRFKK